MYVKKIPYTDYFGKERTEEFHFNLTKAEITEMELSTTGGMSKILEKIMATQDMPALIAIFKDLLLKSYGEPSPDGRRFVKSDKLREEFEQCPAYSEIYMSLVTDTDAAAEFINNIVPADMAKQAREAGLLEPAK